MSDLSVTEPVELEVPVEPIASSACGRTNAYTITCIPTEQSMNYAACLWRQKLISDPTINVPADWSPCAAARKVGACVAVGMRLEEELAGKAIYFTSRGLLHKITDAARRWVMPKIAAYKSGSKTPSTPGATKFVAKTSMLDAMGSAGDLSDAITHAAKTSAVAPLVKRSFIPIAHVANTGETPLAMARRLAATRST